jgi:hypothetical protein
LPRSVRFRVRGVRGQAQRLGMMNFTDPSSVPSNHLVPFTDSFENHMRVVERSGRSYTETQEGTTSIRIYSTPSRAILDMLNQAAGSGVPMTVLPEHLGGLTR